MRWHTVFAISLVMFLVLSGCLPSQAIRASKKSTTPALTTALSTSSPTPTGTFRVHYVNVGQNDAINAGPLWAR